MNEKLVIQIETIVQQLKGNISVFIEINDHTIVQQNDNRNYSAASLIKIPIIMEAYRQSEEGLIDLNQTIKIEDHQKVGGSGVIFSLSEGTCLTVKDILTLMIIVSDNTATNMMIDLVGLDSINRFCKMIGCRQTIVERRLMDYEARNKGYNNVTTASNMVSLLKEIDNCKFLTKNSGQEILKIMSNQQFQDKLPAMMDVEKMFVANKTGEISGVEHDVAIIHYNNNKAYIAVLTDQLENNYQGKQAISQLGKVVYDFLLASAM